MDSGGQTGLSSDITIMKNITNLNDWRPLQDVTPASGETSRLNTYEINFTSEGFKMLIQEFIFSDFEVPE